MNTIKLVRGTSNTINITIEAEDNELYALQDGERVIFGVKEKPEDENLLVLKIATALTGGVATFQLSPADTIGLKYGRYVYDAGLESGENFYNIIEASPFVLLPNITKLGDSL